ncbi:hypothetical protein P7K49_000309 [Saguinus oedipus]|uniref:Uncharacterized protein n=1 Tax=Saguinus oedipus TaxID=9490 RepID=A0ABQ9WBC1_SAGOE|nr:hypothetical protein P7K49_000309 [Saguinus oedipus]
MKKMTKTCGGISSRTYGWSKDLKDVEQRQGNSSAVAEVTAGQRTNPASALAHVKDWAMQMLHSWADEERTGQNLLLTSK